ncbi:MAG: hypothetical protein CHACPFDD_01509 [Phycisphaerae bacterium]|nr:hypothetical protein [Phycisphaerae bacterium]
MSPYTKHCRAMAIAMIGMAGSLTTTLAQIQSSGETLSQSETTEVVSRVAAQQALLADADANFAVQFELRTAEVVDGTYVWLRSDGWERLETHFLNAPQWARSYGLDDEVFVVEPERTIEHFVRTNQVILYSPTFGLPTVYTPLEILRGGTRRDLNQLVADGVAVTASRLGPDLFELRYTTPSAPGTNTTLEVSVRDGAYLITCWQCSACNSSAAIEYDRLPDGGHFPSYAVCELGPDRPVRRLVLATESFSYKPPPRSRIAFRFSTKMIITDSRAQQANGDAPVLRADRSGNLFPIHAVYPFRSDEASSASTLGAGAASAGLILAVLIGRRLHRRKQAA